jgi:hypothetical protein
MVFKIKNCLFLFACMCVSAEIIAQKKQHHFRSDLFLDLFRQANLEYAYGLNSRWEAIGSVSFRKHFPFEKGQFVTNFLENKSVSSNNTTISYASGQPFVDYGGVRPTNTHNLGFGTRYYLTKMPKFNLYAQPMLDVFWHKGYLIEDTFKSLDETVSTCCGTISPTNPPKITLTQTYFEQQRSIQKKINWQAMGSALHLGMRYDFGHFSLESRMVLGYNFGAKIIGKNSFSRELIQQFSLLKKKILSSLATVSFRRNLPRSKAKFLIFPSQIPTG